MQDRTLMRKVDRWLIPWFCLLYLLSFLDRTNIGNARLAGLEADLGMAGHDYNKALAIFFASTPRSYTPYPAPANAAARLAMPYLSP